MRLTGAAGSWSRRGRGPWTLRHDLIGLAGVVERNLYLVRRYIWWDIVDRCEHPDDRVHRARDPGDRRDH